MAARLPQTETTAAPWPSLLAEITLTTLETHSVCSHEQIAPAVEIASNGWRHNVRRRGLGTVSG